MRMRMFDKVFGERVLLVVYKVWKKKMQEPELFVEEWCSMDLSVARAGRVEDCGGCGDYDWF